jgi:single-stranded-DNA-specific exonuclease
MSMDWQINETQAEPEKSDSLIRRFLAIRNLPTDDKSISDFTSKIHLTKEYLIRETSIDVKQIKVAIELINKYIQKKKPIIIYGDYDVDGICATAILWQTLNHLGARVLPFLPKRDEHGYGLSEKGLSDAVKLFPNEKPLIITVDNGITSSKVIKKFDLDFILTDHHQIPTEKPITKALVHTTAISGTGVAFVLSYFLTNSKPPLDLVALATVCDQLPLTGINRQFVIQGLSEIQSKKRIGLKTLIEQSGIDSKQEINTYHLGFVIGPRLNATGRLGHALDALRLLCTNNEKQAITIAQSLNSLNQDRQELTSSGVNSAIDMISKLKKIPKIILVKSPDFHEGIIGLIAAKLSDKFHRPAIAIAEGEEVSKASARSVPGLDITSLLRQVSHVLLDIGGHDGASGFTIITKNISRLETEIEKLEHLITDKLISPHLAIDLLLHQNQDLNEVNLALKRLSPFGPGFKEPLLSLSSLEIISKRLVGSNATHLQLSAKDPNGKIYQAIGFNQATSYPLAEKNIFDFAFFLSENHYNGQITLQLHLQNLK